MLAEHSLELEKQCNAAPRDATGADRLKAGGATNFGREIIATDRAIDGLVYEFSPECARGLRPDLLDRRSADTDAEIGKLVYEFYGITVGCR